MLKYRYNFNFYNMTQHFTDDSFQNEVIEASKAKPVLVDFYASWCGPCKMMSPIIDELATDMEGKAIIGKLNTEECPNMSEKYGIMSIPNIMVFRNGEVVENIVGAQSKEALARAVEKHI